MLHWDAGNRVDLLEMITAAKTWTEHAHQIVLFGHDAEAEVSPLWRFGIGIRYQRAHLVSFTALLPDSSSCIDQKCCKVCNSCLR